MKIVTVTYVIDDSHNIDDYRLRSITHELQRVQDHSEHGLIYVQHSVADVDTHEMSKKDKPGDHVIGRRYQYQEHRVKCDRDDNVQSFHVIKPIT